MLRLRLFHASDGARIAYREDGAGQPLVLWHSRGLNHREFSPAASELLALDPDRAESDTAVP